MLEELLEEDPVMMVMVSSLVRWTVTWDVMVESVVWLEVIGEKANVVVATPLEAGLASSVMDDVIEVTDAGEG